MVLAHPQAGRGQVARHLAAVMDVLRPADPLLPAAIGNIRGYGGGMRMCPAR